MSKEIILYKGEKTLVDDIDYSLQNTYKWHLDSKGYVRGTDGINKKWRYLK